MGFQGGIMINKDDSEYQANILKQKLPNDPKEEAIREKVRASVLRLDWAIDAFAKIRQQQTDYLKESVKNIENETYVHDLTQKILRTISKEVKSKIVEGEELIDAVPKGRPALIATNHFGAYKLLGISPKKDVGVDIPSYDTMYPYLMYFAALDPVARKLGNNLYYTSNDFPGIFGDIHRKAGFIHVPPTTESKTGYLINQTRRAIEKRMNSAIVCFPEGTTSGKPSGRGPYDLEPFKTGGYVVAAELCMHVVPVAQFFNPQGGYELKIMRPFIPEKGGKEIYKNYAEENRKDMQKWLDQRIAYISKNKFGEETRL